MHHFGYKHLVVLILVGLVSFAATINFSQKSKNAPAEDIQALDARLLQDLQQQEIDIDAKTRCLMACQNVNESDLKSLFELKNVNYDKCEAGNCHVTSYTIEGDLKDGKKVSFKLDSGEDGNVLKDLKVENTTCDC